MQIILLTVLTILLAILAFSLLRFRGGSRGDGGAGRGAGSTSAPDASTPPSTRPCPLCRTPLYRGERVHTVVFSGPSPGQSRRSDIREAMVHMDGCRHCRPPQGTAERTCPVCREILEPEDYVIGRMFETEDRKHLRVLGCTRCRRV